MTLREFALAELALLAHEIPLVADENQAFAFFDGEAGQAPVLRGHARHRVEDEQRDVAARDRFKRAQRRVVRDRAVGFGLFVHARRVDQAQRAIAAHAAACRWHRASCPEGRKRARAPRRAAR